MLDGSFRAIGVIQSAYETKSEVVAAALFNSAAAFAFAFLAGHIVWALAYDVNIKEQGRATALLTLLGRLFPHLFIVNSVVFYDWYSVLSRLFYDEGLKAANFIGLEPSEVVASGSLMVLLLWDEVNLLSVTDPGGLALKLFFSFAIISAYLWVGTKILGALFEEAIVDGVGILFVGLGASRLTFGFFQSFVVLKVSVGIRLLVYTVGVFIMSNVLLEAYNIAEADAWTFEQVVEYTFSALAVPLLLPGTAERISGTVSRVFEHHFPALLG
ncbi:MAG: type IV secretion system protein [Planctomycetota bacterium]